jgi:1-acyl-sn-glycerol-3-phosphate acyltransferase
LLQHEPARVRVRDNLKPSEAVFVGQYVHADDVELRTEGRIVVAGSYVDNSYPLDSAEGACRSAYNALSRLASKHPQLRLRSNLGLPAPTRSKAKQPTRPPLSHTNASTAPRLAAVLWSLSTRASIMLTPLVADLDFVDARDGTLPHTKPAIYVSNHRSTFDVPAGFRTFAYLKVVPHLVIARKYFERGPLGVMLRAAGALPALRGTDATITAGIDALRSGDSVAIMPEGRIFGDADEAPAHGRGAAEMSIQTGAPIIPIGAFGTQHVWEGDRPRPLVRRPPRPRVVIAIGPPIWPEGRTVDDLTQHLREVLTSLEESASTRAGIR